MTIASQTSRISYVGDGATTAFTIPFYFQANADIKVYLQSSTGTQTLQVLGTDYTLTGATVVTGGTCTFTTAPTATTGAVVTIYRDPPVTQTTSYNNNDPFAAKSHENALDKLTTLEQRTRDLITRTVQQPESDATLDMHLPVASLRANKVLGFDSNGLPVATTGATYVAGTDVGVAFVSTRSVAAVTVFAASIVFIQTGGLTVAGDGGGAVYKKGSGKGTFNDGGGVAWELASLGLPSTGVAYVSTRAVAAASTFPASVIYIATGGLATAGDGGNATYIQGTGTGGFTDAGSVTWKLAAGGGGSSGSLVSLGRLTLTSGVALTTADVTGATSVYFALAGGNQVPIYNGTSIVSNTFTELTLALDSNSGHTNYQQSGKNYDLFVISDSGTVRLGTGPKWNDGAVAGSDTARGTGAASTELQQINGLWSNKNTITIRFGSASGNTVSIAANQATYVGTLRTTADGVTEDSLVKRFLYNAYNQAQRQFLRNDATPTWAYSTATFRQANASASNQLAYVAGLVGSALDVTTMGIVANSTATYRIVYTGIGLDSTTINSGTTQELMRCNDSVVVGTPKSFYTGYVQLGSRAVVWLEKGAGSDTQTWTGTEATGLYKSGIWGSIFA